MMKKNITTGFLKKIRKNHFISLVFSQPRCHSKRTHPCKSARIKPSVVDLDSCKKRAPMYKQLKNDGELGIGIENCDRPP